MEDQFSTETQRSLVSRKLDLKPKKQHIVKEDRGKSICQLWQKDGAEPLNSRGKQDLGQDYDTCSPTEGDWVRIERQHSRVEEG